MLRGELYITAHYGYHSTCIIHDLITIPSGKKGMQTYSAFDEDFVHNGLLHEKIAVEEKHVEKNI